MNAVSQKKLLRTLAGEKLNKPPIWFMRQAGRYLPEYRELRAKADGFLNFCYTPSMATEATLQPIRRFGFDAAILFCDILVIPDALGQPVSFVAGEGPKLEPIKNKADLRNLTEALDRNKLNLIYETVDRVKAALPAETTFIGFCGAPWTVASYMIAGHGTPDQAPAREFAYNYPELFAELIDKLVMASADFLIGQLKAGVEVVQIFDSWAGVLPQREFLKWSLAPITRIIQLVKASIPDAKIIVFAKGVGSKIQHISEIPNVDCIGIDTATDVRWAKEVVRNGQALQGNLDPLVLLNGGRSLDDAVLGLIDDFQNSPYVFNLGHGILPPTPIENVQRVLDLVRG